MSGSNRTEVEITMLQGFLAGLAALGVSAAVAGSAHYAGTTKALAEEGVETAARMRALPLAVSFSANQ